MNLLREINDLPVIAPRPRVLPDRRQLERRGPSRPPIAGAGESDRRDDRDRRASPRLECELDCEERMNGSRYFRVTRDLSTFGLSTRTGYPHPRGTRFELILHLPDLPRHPISVQAEVLGWDNEDGGMRLAFRNPPADAVRRIYRYLKSRSAARAA
jgi:hypothetical protein